MLHIIYNGTTFNKSEENGIDLSLCKSMIEMHNESINITSKIKMIYFKLNTQVSVITYKKEVMLN